MSGEDACEYLFNHINDLTGALGIQNGERGSLDAEGMIPSNYGMVYFMVFVFIAYVIINFMGAATLRHSEKPARNGMDRFERRDQNDPLN